MDRLGGRDLNIFSQDPVVRKRTGSGPQNKKDPDPTVSENNLGKKFVKLLIGLLNE